MAVNREAVLLSDLVLQLLNVRIFEFDNPVTFGADQVIMVVYIVGQFIAGVSIAELTLLRETAFTKEIEGSIDGGQTNRGALFLHSEMKFFRRNVALGL